MNGQSSLATIDAHLVRLARDRDTVPVRSTASTVYVAFAGSGRSRIGEATLEWTTNDIFSSPHGLWASHRAATDDAVLFEISDRELLRRLGLLREETRAHPI